MPTRRVKFAEEYRDAIGKVRDLAREESYAAAQAFANILWVSLTRHSPEWKAPDPSYLHIYPRDSSRLQRPASISQGWAVDVVRTVVGGTVRIDHSDVERVDWLRFGTKAHRIPKSGSANLFFYWKEPKGDHEGGPGWRKMKWVDHPGIRVRSLNKKIYPDLVGPGKVGNPGDFVMVAVTEAIDEYTAKFNQAIPRVLFPLRRLFGGPQTGSPENPPPFYDTGPPGEFYGAVGSE